jgi:Mn-dependent DtxR family transcriptional regulator
MQKSGEDYLEAICVLSKSNGAVRSIDVAKYLAVTKPSTFKAMQILADAGYITKENYGTINLTPSGQKVANGILEKHNALRKLLVDVLHVSPENAERDACSIEHIISDETTDKLFKFLSNR